MDEPLHTFTPVGNPPDNRVDFLEVGKGSPWAVTEAEAIATDRPVVIYFPGLGHFNDLRVSNEVMRKLHRFVSEYFHSEELPQHPRAVYIAQRRATHTSSAEGATLLLHQTDEDMLTDTARDVVAKVFDPMLPDLTHSHDVQGDVAKAQLEMSRVLLAAHSLGSSYIQQVRNGIVENMSAKGYDDAQQEQVLHSLAALSIGTAIPVNDRSSKDMPTLHIVPEGDEVAAKQAPDNQFLLLDDSNSHLKAHRAGTHLYLQPSIEHGNAIMSAKLLPLLEDVNRSCPITDLTRRDETGTVIPQWGIEVCEKIDVTGHDPRLALNINQRINPMQMTLQSAPGPDIVHAFVESALTASQAAITSGTPRNTAAILDTLEQQHLSEDGRAHSVHTTGIGKSNFREMVDFSRKTRSNSISG